MLRRPAPPASRGRPVQADVRTGLKARAACPRAAFFRRAGPAVLLALVAATTPAAAATDHRHLVGQILYVLNPTTVRTRGGGNLSVDLPRGRSVVLVGVAADRIILEAGPADATLLRAHGVRRVPRYTAAPDQIKRDFAPAPAWEKARAEGRRRVLERWPGLPSDKAERIFLGQPFVGMTDEQAEEAVGAFILARSSGEDGSVFWTVGHRPRSAELRVFTEARERGVRARTFEEFLRTRARAILIFRSGALVSIDPPVGVTPGSNWP